MRKTILSIAFAACTFAASAQENMMSKRGTPILPEVGDYALFFDANPFLNYAGNMFSQNGNNAFTANYPWGNPMTITGLKVNAPNSAYRGKVRLGFGSNSHEDIVPILGNNPNNLTTTNKTKVSATNITLGVGMQKTRGKHRLHANYGADVMIMFGTGSDTTYTYGQNLKDSVAAQSQGPRTTKANTGSNFGFGVRGFVSVEYFFAPKISISAQYGWGIGIMTQGKGTTTMENYDGTSNSVKTQDTKTGKSSSFGADVDNNGASIAIGFYF